MSKNRGAYAVVLLSFAWNIALLIGVVLNLGFAHSRAAGGQYLNFPVGIRIAYILQLALVLWQLWTVKLLFNSVAVKPTWLPKAFFIIGILGILLNAASRSSNERLNVIPATVITWSFWQYGMRKSKSSIHE